MNEPDKTETKAERVDRQLKHDREEALATLRVIDGCAALMERLPEHAIQGCAFLQGQLLIYHQNHEQAMAVMLALGAGKWKRVLNSDNIRLDYVTHIDGIMVTIYGAQPSPACRIVEETVEVPARTEIKRTLICQ